MHRSEEGWTRVIREPRTWGSVDLGAGAGGVGSSGSQGLGWAHGGIGQSSGSEWKQAWEPYPRGGPGDCGAR